MFAVILGIGCVFGFTAGLVLGLPAFALGGLVALVGLVGFEAMAGTAASSILLRAAGLAIALQLAYAFGLLARAVFPSLRASASRKARSSRDRLDRTTRADPTRRD